jgi:hypothetical protein
MPSAASGGTISQASVPPSKWISPNTSPSITAATPTEKRVRSAP